jgi:hypothetical protein
MPEMVRDRTSVEWHMPVIFFPWTLRDVVPCDASNGSDSFIVFYSALSQSRCHSKCLLPLHLVLSKLFVVFRLF